MIFLEAKFKYNIGDRVCLVRPGYPNHMYNSIGIINGRMTDPWGNPEYGINFSTSERARNYHIILSEEDIRRLT